MRRRLVDIRRSLLHLFGSGLVRLAIMVAAAGPPLLYLLFAAQVSYAGGAADLTGLVAPAALLVLVAGMVCVLPLALAVVRRWARWELGRAARLLGREATPLPSLPATGGAWAWVRALVGSTTSWRAAGWACVQATVGLVVGALALAPFVLCLDVVYSALFHLDNGNAPGTLLLSLLDTVFGTATSLWFDGGLTGLTVFMIAEVLFGTCLLFCMPAVARLHAAMTVRLLSGSRVAGLERRVGELAETRAGAVDAHTSELRRIERDLHDGMQAQLVNVTMRLGMAERRLTDDPAAVGVLIEEARSGAEDAMTGLRDVLRTMYPPVLADRGLRGALLGLAGRCTTATTVDMTELDDVPAPVEAAAYFVVAEALTNVAKHSAASHADVTVRREPRALLVEITDNGLGGADEDGGTGIVGMRRRVAALDGWLEVTSPVGGPTIVVTELPCGW